MLDKIDEPQSEIQHQQIQQNLQDDFFESTTTHSNSYKTANLEPKMTVDILNYKSKIGSKQISKRNKDQSLLNVQKQNSQQQKQIVIKKLKNTKILKKKVSILNEQVDEEQIQDDNQKIIQPNQEYQTQTQDLIVQDLLSEEPILPLSKLTKTYQVSEKNIYTDIYKHYKLKEKNIQEEKQQLNLFSSFGQNDSVKNKKHKEQKAKSKVEMLRNLNDNNHLTPWDQDTPKQFLQIFSMNQTSDFQRFSEVAMIKGANSSKSQINLYTQGQIQENNIRSHDKDKVLSSYGKSQNSNRNTETEQTSRSKRSFNTQPQIIPFTIQTLPSKSPEINRKSDLEQILFHHINKNNSRQALSHQEALTSRLTKSQLKHQRNLELPLYIQSYKDNAYDQNKLDSSKIKQGLQLRSRGMTKSDLKTSESVRLRELSYSPNKQSQNIITPPTDLIDKIHQMSGKNSIFEIGQIQYQML